MPIVFSALPAAVARDTEPVLRKQGLCVFSNAAAMRYQENVPILIPEVNPEALRLIETQGFPETGFVVTNAICTTTGLAVALGPLRRFEIQEVFVSTYQSISGAGHPGLSALDIGANTIPFISGEEEKLPKELRKILGVSAAVYPFCVRVPIPFGHLETLWLRFEQDVTEQDVLEAWQGFTVDTSGMPSLPGRPVAYCPERDLPQHKQAFWGRPPGMQVFTGRLRSKGKYIGFALLVNNIIKGAAGGSIANAELFVRAYGGETWPKES